MTTFTVEITDAQMDCLAHDIPKAELNADIQRRLEWVIAHKVEQCQKRMIASGMPELEADPEVTQIPVDKGELAAQIKSLSSYKDRDDRDAL